MDELPERYCNHSKEDISILLEPFSFDSLINESLKSNAKAQRAVLAKVQLGLHETSEWSIKERIDIILWFWEQVKKTNILCEYNIMNCIKRTVLNDFNKSPEYNDVCYAVDCMKGCNLGEKLIIDFLDYYDYIKNESPDSDRQWKE